MNTMAMIPMLTQRMVRLASSPGESAPPPGVRFDWMMKAARSLTSCAVRLSLPPFLGIGTCLGSPGCGVRPLVMMSIRNAGSSGLETPGSFSIGFRAAPIPPSSAAPWQVAQFCAYSCSPLVGSPGRAVEPVAADPLPDGDGDVSAIVAVAVRSRKVGIPSASTTLRDTRIEPNDIRLPSPAGDGAGGGIPPRSLSFKDYGFLLAGLPVRLLLRFQTLA